MKLNTIVLASPKSDVIQSVGRILREKADVRKFHPLVIDIKDIHENLIMFSKQCDKRLRFYKQNNHDIHLYKGKKFNDNEFFYDYLKKEVKEKRKMGHLTTVEI